MLGTQVHVHVHSRYFDRSVNVVSKEQAAHSLSYKIEYQNFET